MFLQPKYLFPQIKYLNKIFATVGAFLAKTVFTITLSVLQTNDPHTS